MKLLPTCSLKYAKRLKTLFIGMAMLILSTFIALSDPLQKLVDWQLTLRPGSILYNLWLKPPLEVLIPVYVFNFTNVQEFISGIDKKLKLQEIGPYVYQEILENHNVTFNENNTVTYSPKRTFRFVAERSVGDPKVDRVIAPNIPYMGLTSAVYSMSALGAIAFKTLTKRMKSQPMVNVSVHEYLWGYEDSLVNLAATFMPNVIKFQNFGILDRILDEGSNVVTMKLPERNTRKTEVATEQVARDYTIDTWNGNQGLDMWNYKMDKVHTTCNSLNGTFDGTLFPRDIKEGDVFRVYRKSFCRSLPLTYSHRSSMNGVEAVTFSLNDNAFDTDLQDSASSCFCKSNKCLKRGLSNVTPCYYNIPLAISFPHFMHADPTISELFEGLHPDAEKHGTVAIIQPQLGIPMKVHSRFQGNILVSDTKYNRDLAPYKNSVLPLIWLEIGIEDLTFSLKCLVQFLFNVGPYLQWLIVSALLLGGVYLTILSLLVICWPLTNVKSTNMDPLLKTTRVVDLAAIIVQQKTKDSASGKIVYDLLPIGKHRQHGKTGIA